MALDKDDFDPTGSGSKGGSAPKVATYGTSDTFATVEGANYFDGIADTLKDGDLLTVYSSAAADGGIRTYNVARSDADVITLTRLSPDKVVLPYTIPQTELLAGTSIELVSPVAGRIAVLRTVVQTEVTTGGDVTVEVDGTAVDGLSITVANSAAKGTVQSDTPTAAHASAVVAVGDRIEIIPSAAFDTAGALAGVLEIELTT